MKKQYRRHRRSPSRVLEVLENRLLLNVDWQNPVRPNDVNNDMYIAPIDAPISYRSVQETRTEQEALETKRLEKEQEYQNKSRQLANRFKDLSEDLQLRLKLVASVHLSKLVPTSEKRETILRDKTFQRMANRAVLETFFEWLDQGLSEDQALQQLDGLAAA